MKEGLKKLFKIIVMVVAGYIIYRLVKYITKISTIK